MTEQQIADIIHAFELFEQADKLCAACIIASVLVFMAICAFELFINVKRNKKIKQWRSEYKATLNEEQLKAIEQYNKIK